jgi:hypothetical protein
LSCCCCCCRGRRSTKKENERERGAPIVFSALFSDQFELSKPSD